MDKEDKPINDDLENAMKGYASGLTKENQDISAIMFDRGISLGKAWLHFEAALNKERSKIHMIKD